MDTTEDPQLWIGAHRLRIRNAMAPWRPTPNLDGTIKPEIIVLHETAGRLDAAGSVAWLCNPAAKASAHVVIARNGTITQLAPFNRGTWHAGQSSYRGRKSCNNFAIGIELVGPDQMRAGKAGHARAWFGEEYLIATHGIQRRRTVEHGDGWWMPFTATQIKATTALCKALADAYDLKDITTHWAISPGRKVDPNPLFPLEQCRIAVLGRNVPPMGGA